MTVLKGLLCPLYMKNKVDLGGCVDQSFLPELEVEKFLDLMKETYLWIQKWHVIKSTEQNIGKFCLSLVCILDLNSVKSFDSKGNACVREYGGVSGLK